MIIILFKLSWKSLFKQFIYGLNPFITKSTLFSLKYTVNVINRRKLVLEKERLSWK